MKRKLALVLTLCMLAPISATAVTEGVVEAAPMVTIEPINRVEESYLPDASYYAGAPAGPAWENVETWVECEQDEDGLYLHTTQNPRLTLGEQKRAKRLMEQNAVYTGESVLEKTENVVVGVYALDPADYDGEQAYVLLPGTCLTDEQLLSIIAAYEALGLTFDPAALTYRNCARGGGIETTRFYKAEESERNNNLAEMIRRGQLIPPEHLDVSAVRYPKLQSEYFSGMTEFTFVPYRRQTDEEMVAQLLASGVRDETGEIDHSNVEARSRTALYQAFRCPLSMQLEYVYTDGGYAAPFFTKDGRMQYDYGAWTSAFGASFTYRTQEDILVYVHTAFDKQTNELTSMSITHDSPEQVVTLCENVTQEKVAETVRETERFLGLSGLEWHVMWDGETFTNWGLCIPVRAVMGDEWMFTIFIGGDDGKAHGFDLSRGTLVDAMPKVVEGQNN